MSSTPSSVSSVIDQNDANHNETDLSDLESIYSSEYDSLVENDNNNDNSSVHETQTGQDTPSLDDLENDFITMHQKVRRNFCPTPYLHCWQIQ